MDRKDLIYYNFMKKVVEDGIISLDESGLVIILEERLGLSDDRMDEIMGMIEDGEEVEEQHLKDLPADETEHLIEKDIFERVLKEACSDEQVTERELHLLDELANIMDIGKEEKDSMFREISCDPDSSVRVKKALRRE